MIKANGKPNMNQEKKSKIASGPNSFSIMSLITIFDGDPVKNPMPGDECKELYRN